MIRLIPLALWLFVVLSISNVASSAVASEISKEACVESHSRGQDAREEGRLSLARKLFMTCAQPACPALVQNDCARYADDLERQQPWISFAARDASGHDLPDTAVYVDEVLVVTRLDDGKPHEVDPGKHVVRFAYGGREQTVTLVVGSGEKGRTVVGTFAALNTTGASPPVDAAPTTTHAAGSRVLIGASAALVLGGGLLAVVELMRVPAECSLSSHECASEPGDASFDDAANAVRWMNVGWVASGVGAAGLTAGLVWYFKSGKSDERDTQVAPFATSSSAGLVIRGRL